MCGKQVGCPHAASSLRPCMLLAWVCVCPQASWRVPQPTAPLVAPAADPDAHRSLCIPLDRRNLGNMLPS